MQNVSHNKGWVVDTNLEHSEPPSIMVVKETSTCKSDGSYVKLKLRRYPTSSTSDLYEFRIYLFNHAESEKFFLFVKNLQMTLEAKGTLEI